MSALPEGTLIADAFSGIGVTEDRYYAVCQFAQEDGPVLIAFPADQLSALIESAALHSLDGRDDGKVQAMAYFEMRDATLNETVGGDLLLRVGFGPESNIRFRLPREGALQLSDILRQAGTGALARQT